jgi:hypothetical protein
MAESLSTHYDDIEYPSQNGTEGGNLPNQPGNPSPGRPSMESYMNREKSATNNDSSEQHYRDRCSRLEGELHDSDRKIRKQVDEIMQLKRELSADRTETLLSHQKELSEAKESHRNEIERLKEDHRREIKDYETQINRLEKDAFKLELEMKTGNRDVASKIFDLIEENMPGFVAMFTQAVASQGPSRPQPGQPHQPGPATGPQRPSRAGSDEELAKVLGQLYESQQGSQPHSEPDIPSDNADPESGKGASLAALPSDRPGESPNESFQAGKNGQQKVAL